MKLNMVRKSNSFIEACYSMSVPELRLVYSCISQIEYKQIIDKDKMFYLTASEYSEIFNIEHSNAHKELHQAVDKIWEREITIKRDNESDLITRWISSKANWGNGEAEIRFAPDVIPYLTHLLEFGNFTIYELGQISGLKSSYAIRLYELFIQYKKIGKRELTVAQIRNILDLGNKYKRMCDFKKYVLDLSIKEINKHSDVIITYKQIKKRQEIVSFIFSIKLKSNSKKKLSPLIGKKYLTTEEVDKKGRIGENYPDLYARLKAEGYSFDVKHKHYAES